MTLNNQICLITGATSGIGKQTALMLANHGACIIITGRNAEKGKLCLKEIIEKSGNRNVEFFLCDQSSLESVRAFADSFHKKYRQLHVLINNAGTWEMKRKLSKDGYEMNMAVNHLAHFLLTNLLLGTIKSSAPARIISVASSAHKGAAIDFNDLQLETGYSWFKGYSQSKLMNILFIKALAEKLKGTEVTANCLHPGVILTPLFKDMNPLARFLFKPFTISPAKGAETSVYLAISDEVSQMSGLYFAKKRPIKSSSVSNDLEAANELWKKSSELCGLV